MAIEFNIEIQDWNDGEPVVAYMRLSEFSAEDIMLTQEIPATETSGKSVGVIIIPRVYMRAVIERLEAASVLDIRESDPEPEVAVDEDGDELPRCVVAMGCYCAGHARGNPASDPCDTSEAVAR